VKIDRVIIDPGHGGFLDGVYQTAGKRFTFVPLADHAGQARPPEWSIFEGERMRVLAGFLAADLAEHGIAVYSSLTGEELHDLEAEPWQPVAEDVGLRQRVAHGNSFDDVADVLFLSLHSNAISRSSRGRGQTRASGICVFTSEGQTGSDPVATAIHRDLAALEILPARSQSYEDGDPDYEDGFYVLRKTRGRAVLLELGFHDNPDDARILLEDDNLRDFAHATALAIADFGAAEFGPTS